MKTRSRARPVGVAVVGAGYWGPNLVRNLSAYPGCELLWVCDLEVERAARSVGRYSTIATTASLDDVLTDPRVEAVAITTPAATHHRVAMACLKAGRHVLIEKPLAPTVAEGRELVEAAHARGRVLMLDHTYCFTPAALRLRELVADGTIGDIQYVDSVRINLGLVQRDVSVLWDLAPHDLSILDFVLPEDCRPLAVAAQGADPIGAGRACVGYLSLPLRGGGIAHVHVNWLSPTKIRTTIIGGSRRTVVWNDLDPAQRLTVYDRGVELAQNGGDPSLREALMVSYRVGDMVAPALQEQEALQGVVREFASAIRQHRAPITDGGAGLRVLEILEAADRTLKAQGTLVPLSETAVAAADGRPPLLVLGTGLAASAATG